MELPAELRIHPVFHISLLKQYKESNEFNRTTPLLPIFIPETQHEEYEVEAILDKNLIRKKVLYLIKWAGYPLHEATWEPVENLTNTQQKVKEFENQRGC